MIGSLRYRTIQILWFLIREIIEVATSRSAIQSYRIYKHDQLGTVAFSYEALLNETYHEVKDTNNGTQIMTNHRCS